MSMTLICLLIARRAYERGGAYELMSAAGAAARRAYAALMRGGALMRAARAAMLTRLYRLHYR